MCMNKNANRYVVSVIVPVYNVECYLERCLDSILSQTYTNLEIILINDGSTDQSSQICDAYVKRDPRIRVIHQRNQGVSAARDVGLENATGEFIGFVDADDWIEPDMYEVMIYKIQEENCEVVICDYDEIHNDQLIVRHDANAAEAMCSEQYVLYILERIGLGRTTLWSKLFRRAAIAGVRFDRSFRYTEDLII